MTGSASLQVTCTVLVLHGCCGVDDVRPWTTPVDCRAAGAPQLPATFQEVVDRGDADGDGLLSHQDLVPGEVRLVLRVEGEHSATGLKADQGYSMHSDLAGRIYLSPGNIREVWVLSARTNCLPFAHVQFAFQDENDRRVSTPEGGPAVSMAVDITEYEVIGAEGLRGNEVTVAEDEDAEVSGYWLGNECVALFASFPDESPTGQSVCMEGLAFRAIDY